MPIRYLGGNVKDECLVACVGMQELVIGKKKNGPPKMSFPTPLEPVNMTVFIVKEN